MGKKKATSKFDAFPKGTLKFLRDLRKNNNKSWFEAHRAEYENNYVGAAVQFVETVGPKLQKIAPEVIADARINGSIRRINRDTRFSKDKTPYKDHLDFAFGEGDRKSSGSAFFLRVSPDYLAIGAGFHQCPEMLKPFREAVAREDSGGELAAVAKKLRGQNYEIAGAHYKRHPKGFREDGPAAEFLLHNSLYVIQEDPAASANASDMVENCIKTWKKFAPLHRWIMDHVR